MPIAAIFDGVDAHATMSVVPMCYILYVLYVLAHQGTVGYYP